MYPTQSPARVVIEKQGAYLQTESRLLARVDRKDWQGILDWLRQKLDGDVGKLLISHTERYLSD